MQFTHCNPECANAVHLQDYLEMLSLKLPWCNMASSYWIFTKINNLEWNCIAANYEDVAGRWNLIEHDERARTGFAYNLIVKMNINYSEHLRRNIDSTSLYGLSVITLKHIFIYLILLSLLLIWNNLVFRKKFKHVETTKRRSSQFNPKQKYDYHFANLLMHTQVYYIVVGISSSSFR